MSLLLNRTIQIFKENKRALYSWRILLGICFVSIFIMFFAQSQPIMVKYYRKIYMPYFQFVSDEMLGGVLPTSPDYQDEFLKTKLRAANGWIIMPIIPYNYETIDYKSEVPFPAPPSRRHLLGTDDVGRDVLARALYGVRASLFFGILLAFLSAILGVIVGGIQGYFGGKTDLIMGRFLEIWSSLPQLFILIIVSSVIAPSFLSLLIVLLLFSWTSLTGVVRAEFLKTRNADYVKSAKTLGVSDIAIMVRHILPNALVATITYLPFMISASIVSLSALDFLGFGLPVGTPSLGDMIKQGKENLDAPWIGLTALCLMTGLVSLFLFIGEGIRDAFDPNHQIKDVK